MATVPGLGQWLAKGVHKNTWTGLTGTDTGAAHSCPQLADKTVQISGTFATATVVIEGSNDGGSTWFTLTDPQGNNISKTAAAMETIAENPQMIRPKLTAGTTDAINVTVISQSTKR